VVVGEEALMASGFLSMTVPWMICNQRGTYRIHRSVLAIWDPTLPRRRCPTRKVFAWMRPDIGFWF
jgi:hypothetical protein